MVIVAGGDNNSLQRRFNFYIETRREMEKLRGILQNAISKLEDISSPPNEKKKTVGSIRVQLARFQEQKRVGGGLIIFNT